VLEFVRIQDLDFREIQGRRPVNMQRTVPLMSYEMPSYQKIGRDIIAEINAPDERTAPPRQIRTLVMGTRLVNLPPKPLLGQLTFPMRQPRDGAAQGSVVRSSSYTRRLVSKSLSPEAAWS
jgi:hypothetical protein